MRKILTSLGMVVFAGAVVVGATGAFFSDTETSTGNTFTAGEIDLQVDSQAHYAGLICVDNTEDQVDNPTWQDDPIEANGPITRPDLVGDPCDGTWALTDLGPTHQFFNLSDIKPGDEGENTISLHVFDNDAWACADVAITSNDDVSSTEPELGSGDVQDVPDEFDGELADNIFFFAWDDDGDNIWEDGELPLFTNTFGPASDVLGGVSYPLAVPPLAPLPGGVTNYIGLAWCAGTMTVDTTNEIITCDGAGMGNNTQTDELIASITFRVEQSRNNPDFTCELSVPVEGGDEV